MQHDDLVSIGQMFTAQIRERKAEQAAALERLKGEVPAHFVPTTVSKTILTRCQIVHKKRRIGIFSGPPGTGKTTAIEAFRALNPGRVGLITPRKGNATARLAMQHMVEAVRQLSGQNIGGYVYPETFSVARQLRSELALLFRDAVEDEPRLTLVFDEAQTLSRAAIEELRYWNDCAPDTWEFPIGLVFVGNNEFSLSTNASGQSVISAAVADRARFIEIFDYADMTDEDMALFIQSHGIIDPAAVVSIIGHFRKPRAIRSLRQVVNLLEEIADESGGAPVTADTVRAILNP